MGRLISMLGAGLAYVSIASVLALATLVGIGFYSGKLTSKKLARLRTVLHEADDEADKGPKVAVDLEQPSYEEILEQRAVNFRELELREEIVRQNVNLLNRQRLEITSKRQDFDQVRQAFQEELAQMQNAALVAGEENVRLTFENLKPAQAKQQILLMLERGEIDKVVSLLASISVGKRAKIAAEFTTPEDAQRLSNMLELMGEGAPLADLVEKTKNANANQPTQR